MYYFHTSDQRKASAYTVYHKLHWLKMLTRYMHCFNETCALFTVCISRKCVYIRQSTHACGIITTYIKLHLILQITCTILPIVLLQLNVVSIFPNLPIII